MDVPTREQLDQTKGSLVVEFGASWCGYCRAFAPKLASLREKFPGVRYLWVEDGPGERLGRSYRVKLWPTLVFLHDGQVVDQMARPSFEEALRGFENVTVAGEDVSTDDLDPLGH